MKDRRSLFGNFNLDSKKENQSEINDSSSNDLIDGMLEDIHDTLEDSNEVPIEEDIEFDEETTTINEEDIKEPSDDTYNSKPSDNKEYIDVEDAFKDEDSLMDSLLADADDLLSMNLDNPIESKEVEEETLSTTLEDENNIETEEQQFEIEEEQNSSEGTFISEPIEDYSEEYPEDDSNSPEFVYTEEEPIDNSQYYNDSEINAKRKKTAPKGTFLKVIVGACAIVVIAGACLGARYIMNNKDTLFNNNKEEISSTEENIPSNNIEIPTQEPIQESTEDLNSTNNTSGIDVENEEKDEVDLSDKEEQVSSFIQTFTGYIVDINNTDIYVSDKITSDQVSILENDFELFMSETDTKVYIKEIDENTETDTTTEDTSNDIIIIGGSSNTSETTEESTTNSSDDKIYHAYQVCEFSESTGLIPVKLSELSSDYTACEICKDEITQTNNTVLDYDYSAVSDLASIIFKKFNVDAEDIPSWATIGTKVTISYIQNEDTYLNDVIEISRAKSESTNASEITQLEGDSSSNSDEEDDYRLSNTNIFGSEFDTIIATINDRKKNSTKDTGNVLDDELSIAETGTRETVTSQVAIGSCEYVWIQIVWKKNGDTKSIPDVEDVTVELQTPSGSLVNESNINSYGKKWINKRVINYVLKNPKTGNWTVLFTKDIGTYLGDVTIQAAPMTGFLQIKKAAAKYTEGTLKCIWQATGVSDDYCKVQIYARNGNNDILLYSGNTIDDDVRTVDMVDIDTAKIAGNIYDIVIKITDIDVTASDPKKITYQFITDEYIVENVEIPSK